MGNISENVSSPEEETGLQGNSKLCINVKYNTGVPDFSENVEEETAAGFQGKSEYEVQHSTSYLITLSLESNSTIPQSSRM